jgi:hypothetical protein
VVALKPKLNALGKARGMQKDGAEGRLADENSYLSQESKMRPIEQITGVHPRAVSGVEWET